MTTALAGLGFGVVVGFVLGRVRRRHWRSVTVVLTAGDDTGPADQVNGK